MGRSPDSNVDLRDTHVLPVEKVAPRRARWGSRALARYRMAKDRHRTIEGDDGRKFFGMLLKKNSYLGGVSAGAGLAESSQRKFVTRCIWAWREAP